MSTPERVKILEVLQGRYRDLTGQSLDEVMKAFQDSEADFYQKFPTAVKGRSFWSVQEVKLTDFCRWGCEWYLIEDGRLRLWKTNYDSSG